MSNFKIIFIHGYTSSDQRDWYPTITKELKKLNIDYAIPNLPGYKHPHAEIWLQTLHKEIQKTNKPLILVGHSLGTRAALLYLEKYRPKVKAVILIAAFANRLENAQRRGGDAYPDFFAHTIKIDEIKPLSDKFVVIHSLDDSSINYQQGVEIAHDLGAQLITYNHKDHFSEPRVAIDILKELRLQLDF